MDSLTTLPIPSAMQTIVVVWLAILIERLLPISKAIDPLSFYQFVCERMANKVLKAKYSDQQALTSGSLGLFVLVIPALFITYLVHSFASYQWLLDILLLWVLLQFNKEVDQYASAITALSKGKKQLAKDLMQSLMLRKTSNLSPLGLSKACLESMFLRYHHQQVTVVFCFLVGGPIFALAYRLCYQANQCWNPKRKEFSHFGQLTSIITQFIQFVPAIYTSITFVFFSAPTQLGQLLRSKQYWYNLSQGLRASMQQALLFSLAVAMNIKTSGPVMYGDTKIRRPRLQSSLQSCTDPTLSSIKTLISLSNRHLILSMLVITGITLCLNRHLI